MGATRQTIRLMREPQPDERIQRERRITDPRRPKSPVSLAPAATSVYSVHSPVVPISAFPQSVLFSRYGGEQAEGNENAPVARAADVLGQTERGAGNDGAGRLVDEQLERERAAVHGLFPGAGVRRAPDPRVPVVVRLLHTRARAQIEI